jgi:hypothetical protein
MQEQVGFNFVPDCLGEYEATYARVSQTISRALIRSKDPVHPLLSFFIEAMKY